MRVRLREALRDKFFFSTFNPTIVPFHLALLDWVATMHPCLQPAVAAVVQEVLDTPYALDSSLILELRRMLLDRLLLLSSLGHVLPVLAYMQSRIYSNDVSLSVYFLLQVGLVLAQWYHGVFILANSSLCCSYWRSAIRHSAHRLQLRMPFSLLSQTSWPAWPRRAWRCDSPHHFCAHVPNEPRLVFAGAWCALHTLPANGR